MTAIIPAILPKNFVDLEDQFSALSGLTSCVQIDVCDGKFVPSHTWPYQVHHKFDMDFEDIVSERKGMPFWDSIDFEVDLMVADPEKVLQNWVSAGATRAIVHIESITNFSEIISFKNVIELSLAISLNTPIEKIAEFANEITNIQCMGIARIGFQGEPFDDRVIEKVATLRRLYPSHSIAVDGGVSLQNASKLISAGADRLVVGSAISQSGNPKEVMDAFNLLI